MRETEPLSVTQGEPIEWTRTFTDYPATEWTLEYRFRGPGTGFNLAGVADTSAFITSMSAAVSAAAVVGKWQWQAWVTNIADTSVKRMLDAGFTVVLQGFATGVTTAIDLRSDAKIMLDALDAALLSSGTSDVVEYEITTPAGGRRVKRGTRSEVLAMRKYWAGIVARENAAERVRNGGSFGTSVKVRMFEQ